MKTSNVESLRLSLCLSLPFRERKHFPDCPAVYVVYATPDIILYIGATQSLKNRWQGSHVTTFRLLSDIRVAWFPLPQTFHKRAETKLIETYCPVLNANHKPKGHPHINTLSSKKIQRYIQKQRHREKAD